MLLILAACDPETSADPVVYAFPEGFRWGAASAAHQVEGNNTNNNWYQFETLPEFADKVSEPSGQATNNYELHETDADLLQGLGADIYRLSIEWSRVEPERGVWDETEWAHYRTVLEELRDRGVEPMVTLHHFTEPIWFYDLTDIDCESGPSDTNLCGWANPDAQTEFAEFSAEAAARFGDLVDEWSTFNEPGGYLLSGYLGGAFPPGISSLSATAINENVFPVAEGMFTANALAYDAVHAADTEDADGDGNSASVGFTDSIQYIVPLDPENADDIAAADRLQALYGYIFPDALLDGKMDRDLDGTAEESHPEWANKCDLLGYQYYFRMKVKYAKSFPPIEVIPCDAPVLSSLGLTLSDVGCPEPYADDVTDMGYEHYSAGLGILATQMHERYPGAQLRVTEAGIATTYGKRRAESIVQQLVGLHAAIESGAPVDGYIHWSLTDNFEWASGFTPRFGLHTVDYDTFERTANEGAEIYAKIIADNGIRQSLVDEYGGEHLSPNPD